MQCKKEEIRTHASIKNREEEKEEGGVEERERWGLGVGPRESGLPGMGNREGNNLLSMFSPFLPSLVK